MKTWALLVLFVVGLAQAEEKRLAQRSLGRIDGVELLWSEYVESDDEDSYHKNRLEYFHRKKDFEVDLSRQIRDGQKVLSIKIEKGLLVLSLGAAHAWDGNQASVAYYQLDLDHGKLKQVSERDSRTDLGGWVKAKQLLTAGDWREASQLVRQLRLKGDTDPTFTVVAFGELTPIFLRKLPQNVFVSKVKTWVESWVFPAAKLGDFRSALASAAWYGDLNATTKPKLEAQAVLWERLAKLLLEGNEPVIAEQILRWVVDVAPGFSEAHSWLALTYKRNNWPELAAKHNTIFDRQMQVFHRAKTNPDKAVLSRILIEETEKWLKFRDRPECVDFENIGLAPFAINEHPRTFTIPRAACFRGLPLEQAYPLRVDVTKRTVNAGVLREQHRFGELYCAPGAFLDTPERFTCTLAKSQAVSGLPLKARTPVTLDHHRRAIAFTLTDDTRIREFKMRANHPVVLERTAGQDHTVQFQLAEEWPLEMDKIPAGTVVSTGHPSLPLPEDFEDIPFVLELSRPTTIQGISFLHRVELGPKWRLLSGDLAKPWRGKAGEYCAQGQWIEFSSDKYHFRCGHRTRQGL